MQDRNNINDYWYFKFYMAFYSFGYGKIATHICTHYKHSPITCEEITRSSWLVYEIKIQYKETLLN